MLERSSEGPDVAPEVPGAVAQIVLKLLSKTPEDRYQSARGLRRDLERCLAEWTLSGTIKPFTPGEHDASDQLQIPQKLYGRDAEMAFPSPLGVLGGLAVFLLIRGNFPQ
ncbi:hypothetical protein WMF27_16510 [Sorangium sp. So ce281]|uniref:hypothetical protein n=1 Tax=unclassified Sorangium TaxID=2621164 RepID=UPI003F605A1C